MTGKSWQQILIHITFNSQAPDRSRGQRDLNARSGTNGEGDDRWCTVSWILAQGEGQLGKCQLGEEPVGGPSGQNFYSYSFLSNKFNK